MLDKEKTPLNTRKWRFQKNATNKVVGWFLVFFAAILAFFLLNQFVSSSSLSWKIYVTQSVAIDGFGALIPVVVSLACLILCLTRLRFSIEKYACFFLLALCLDLIFVQPEQDSLSVAIVSPTILVILLISPLVVLLVFGNWLNSNPKKYRFPDTFEFTAKGYALALLIVSSCFTLPIFLVDITMSRNLGPFIGPSYIGGSGLADGIMRSLIFAPILVTMLISSVFLVYSLNRFLETTAEHNKIAKD